MRLQVKLQQFQKHFRIQHGRRQPQSARKSASKCSRECGRGRCAVIRLRRCEFQIQMQLLHRQRASSQARTYLLQHAIQQKRQRLEQHDGIFQIHALGKN